VTTTEQISTRAVSTVSSVLRDQVEQARPQEARFRTTAAVTGIAFTEQPVNCCFLKKPALL
jgi:hypothetical protein